MKPSYWVRTLAGLAAFVAALTGHAGILLLCIAIDAALSAWEIAFIALLFDLLWAPPISLYVLPWYTIAALALLWTLEPLRREFLS